MLLYLCILGFDKKILLVIGLEEFWLYKFKVIVVIVKGNIILEFLSVFRII